MSNHFEYRGGRLFAEDCDVANLVEQYGTPLYLYSAATLSMHLRAWQEPLGDRGMICYAVKANSNLGVLSLLASQGSGFDIVSGGELHRVLKAGGSPDRIVFSGVGKTADEIRMALNAGIHCFNVESETELELINSIAGELGIQAPMSLRVNPDVDAKTHPYISTGLSENKFGVDIKIAHEVYERAAALPNIRVNIGSQLTDLTPYWDTLDRVLNLVDSLSERGIELEHIDLGGGLGVTYQDETPPVPAELYQGLFERLGDRPQKLVFEPGRSIAANAGVLVTKALVLKESPAKNFAIVDTAMNDMLRPALYQSWMNITSVIEPGPNDEKRQEKQWDVVGPVCETGDFLGKERSLAIAEGDLLCIHSAGAYGFVMSSNYNSRPRAAEVMVSENKAQIVRERETLESLVSSEHTFS